MRSILEELFYGNICPETDFRGKDAKTRKLMAHLANHHEALSGTLTEKQKELLEKLDDCNMGKIIIMCFGKSMVNFVRHNNRKTTIF